ncbi:Aldo/keto reductase [Abortiporus biennis]|nr:Aldo/keto reductase [Abortiporus biennis]
MVVALDSPQPVFTLPPLDSIPDTEDDLPTTGDAIPTVGPLSLPEIIFGAASFSHQYNSDGHLASVTPLRTIRLALRYGITAFDTSAFYGPSEIVLGTALKTLEPEFPRSSYTLMTKCGRYGPTKAEFNYSPAAIRTGVYRSLSRLNTEYLDTVYLHDVEFVCDEVQPRADGNHLSALTIDKVAYGLAEGDEGKIHGEGDQKILDAFAELRKMKAEGKIRNIGITGYPLPVLLRVALLILHNPPYEPVDVLLSYSHLNLQNDTMQTFLPQLRDRARISQFVAASPINMGLLSPSPPSWHPAPQSFKDAARKANEVCVKNNWPGGLPNIALGFAYRKSREMQVPMVVGLSQLREVHENVKVWRELREESGTLADERAEVEKRVLEAFKEVQGWSWASP